MRSIELITEMSSDPRLLLGSHVRPSAPSIQETTTRPTGPTKPTKDDFQFIQIYQASGRPDAAGGTQMRKHIRRNHHDNIRWQRES